MSQDPGEDITELLADWRDGDDSAADRLISLLYDELRAIARRHLSKEADGHTVNTTALVHEAYLGLAHHPRAAWESRTHFLAASSRVMRHILVDYSRRRAAAKRGGDQIRVPLDTNLASVAQPRHVDILDLDRALSSLASHDPRMAQVVEFRYFGGMTEEEAAEALDVSPRTVRRLWKRSRVYLLKELEASAS